jgi:hypothetical protein
MEDARRPSAGGAADKISGGEVKVEVAGGGDSWRSWLLLEVGMVTKPCYIRKSKKAFVRQKVRSRSDQKNR